MAMPFQFISEDAATNQIAVLLDGEQTIFVPALAHDGFTCCVTGLRCYEGMTRYAAEKTVGVFSSIGADALRNSAF